jgi:2-polyprenyl-3-methyl-5-hydroxy-6-metoxy-1,4-benzoquinol methylase
VVGIDASHAVVERIRTQMGLRALAGSLPQPELVPASFDVITMWQALEHVHRPLDVLREAKRLLTPGGKLVIAVPNIDSGPFRWFGPDWFGLDLPRHLTHFSAATLRRMVEQAGFRVDRVRMVSHASWLQASARRAIGNGRENYLARRLRSRSVCRLAVWYCVLTGSSDAVMLTAIAQDATP